MKRFASGLVAILTMALAFPAGAFAQNLMTVQNASGDPGDNGVVVRVELVNSAAVGGFQFTLTDMEGDLTPQSVRAGTRLTGLFTLNPNIVLNVDGTNGKDEVRVLGVSLDTQTQQTLAAGNGVIVEVLYNVDAGATGGPFNLTLSDVVLADPSAVEISPVTATDGLFSLVQTPPTTLSFENTETTVSIAENGIVTISMDNAQLTGTRSVAGIEFILVDGSPSQAPISDVVDYVPNSIAISGRASTAGFVADANATAEGLKVTIANFDGGIIPAGTGAIAQLQFNGISSGTAPLAFSNVILADGDAVALPQGTHTGTQVRVNASPTLENIETAPLPYIENDAPKVVTQNITVSDDGGQLNQATVQITAGYQNGADILSVNTQALPGGITPTFDQATAKLTLIGTASIQDYQAALRAVTYQNTSNDPVGTDRTITFSTDDGQSPGTAAPVPNVPSLAVSRDIRLTFVNDAPSFTKGPDKILNEDAGAQNISGWATALSAGGEANQALSFNIIGNTNPGLFSEVLVVTPEGGLRFTPASDSSGTAQVTVTIQDDGGTGDGGVDTSPAQTFNITVNAVNDPPTISAPTQMNIAEDASVTFSDGNLISIGDIDAGSNDVKVTLTATSTVTLGSTSGVIVTGDGTDNVVVTGEVSAVNGSLANLIYTPTLNNDGDGSLKIDVTDQGNTGSGGTQLASHTVNIGISPVNDAPTITNTVTSSTIVENQPLNVTVTATDLEGDAFTFTALSKPSWLNLDPATGKLSGTPDGTQVSTHAFQITVTETSTSPPLSSSKDFTIIVTQDNTSPSFSKFPTVQEIKETSAVFLWEADEQVKGKAEAIVTNQQTGASSILAIQANPAETAEFLKADRVTVDGLSSGTDYTATVTITDRRGNATTSSPILFKTLQNADTTPPVFENLPVLVSRTENTLTYRWSANEAAKATLTLTQKDGADLSTELEFTPTATFAEKGEISATGLDTDALYQGRISLADASGNTPPLVNQGGSLTNNPASVEDRTRPIPDNTKPVATSEPVTDVSNTTANILYRTNEDATTVIEYGETNALGQTFTDGEFVRDHNARLTGLNFDTKYFFRLGAGADRSGNTMIPTALQSFKTKQTPDTANPLFTNGPSVISLTDVAAVLRWKNNELTSFVLEVTEQGTTNINRVSSGDLELTRTVTVSNLKPGTDYDLSLVVKDAAGNSGAARTGTFRTKDVVDTVPPRITGALSFTADDTRIRAAWVTDEASDSRGEIFGPTVGTAIGDLIDVVNDPDLTSNHELTFTGLTPDTKYTIKIRSLDANSNEVASQGEKLTRTVPDSTAPSTTGFAAAADVGRALIKWRTSEPANSRVFFSTTENDLSGDASAAQSVTSARLVTVHAVPITGLGAGAQKYFYKVQSRDAAGNTSNPAPEFAARSFTTLAAEPTLSITGGTLNGGAASTTTATVSWETNVPSTSRVQFGVGSTARVVEDGTSVTSHLVTLTGLTPGSPYQFRVSSTNTTGSQTVSAPGPGKALQTFLMPNAADTFPPLLTQRPSREYKADKKVILRWRTDEKATSTVFYRETGQVNFIRQDKLPLKADFTNHLVQIEGLTPGTGYDFVIESADGAGNTLRFPSTAVVTKLATGLYKITGINQLGGGIGAFTTNQAPDTQSPVILSGPIVTSTNTDQVTLTWATDELSTSTVNFGTGGNTDQQVEDGTLVTSHAVTVTGLSASTVYTYAVSSTDPSNNGPSTSIQAVVQTSAQADVTPPVISNINTSTTFVSSADGASATITWDTDESADTQVEFGTTAALGQNKTESEAVTSHSVTITRLTPSTTYSFRVASTDVSNNGPSTSTIATFTTASAADTSPPTFTNFNTSATTNAKVEVSWNTNENASSILLVINAANDTSRAESGALTTTHTLSVTDANFISAGTAYTVVVQGVDNTGNPGTREDETVTTSASADVTPAAVPTNLSATAGNGAVLLEWTAVSDADLAGYNVFAAGSQVASNLTQVSYTVTGLTNGTAVAFEVLSADQTGNQSAKSASVSETPALTSAPSKPTAIGTFEGGSEVTTVSLKPILVVQNVTPATRRLNNAATRSTPTYTFAVYSDVGLTNLVTSISGVSEGTTTNPTHWQVSDPTLTDGVVLLDATGYFWRVRANDGVTDSPWSDAKTFTTSASKPTAIQLAGFAAESDRGIVDIRWQTFSNLGLRGFNVYRGLNPGGPFELISGEALISATESEYVFQDRDVRINVTYYYQVEAINQDEAPQTFGPITVKVVPPNSFTLDQNFPNPFNPTTSVRYELPVSGQVQLMVYNLLGQAVVTLIDGPQQAGFHTVTWNGQNQSNQAVASGVYFYRIVVTGDDEKTFTRSKKMLLLK